MTTTRKPRTLSQTLRAALVMPAAFALTAGVAYAAHTLSPADAEPAANPTSQYDRVLYADKLDRLTERHDCGDVPEGVIPAHALLLLDGDVEVVSFDRGWAAYQGTGTGTLLSVCAR